MDNPELIYSLFASLCELPLLEAIKQLDQIQPTENTTKSKIKSLLIANSDKNLPELSPPNSVAAELSASTTEIETPSEFTFPSDKFTIGDPIGRGSSSIVYKGSIVETGEQVAIKVLSSSHANTTTASRFLREYQILTQLDHPRIVKAMQFGVNDKDHSICIAMEYINGIRIDKYVRTNQLPVDEILSLFIKVAMGINHAHQHGIIHRDIKPTNVLVTPDAQLKVIDFGIGLLHESNHAEITQITSHGQLLGTLPYMSPEQIRGVKNQIDTRADVYSLGCLLFKLLTGSTPHDVSRLSIVDSIQEVLHQPTRRLKELQPELHHGLGEILSKAIQPDPDKRYQSVYQLMDDVQRHIDGAPLSITPTNNLRVVTDILLRHRKTTILIAIVLFVSFGLTAFISSMYFSNVALRSNLLLLIGLPEERASELSTEELLEITKSITHHAQGDKSSQSALALAFGNAFSDSGRTDLAVDMYSRAKNLSEQSTGRFSNVYPWALVQLCGIEARSGNRILAFKVLEDYIMDCRDAKARRSLGIALGQLGYLYQTLKINPQAAYDFTKESNNILNPLNSINLSEFFDRELQLAKCLNDLNRPDEAHALLQKLKANANSHETDLTKLYQVKQVKAGWYWQEKQYKKALNEFKSIASEVEQILETNQSSDLELLLLESLNSIGLCSIAIQNLDDAELHLKKAIHLADQYNYGNYNLINRLYSKLALTYYLREDFDQAYRYTNLESHGNKRTNLSIIVKGLCLYEFGEYSDSIRVLSNSIAPDSSGWMQSFVYAAAHRAEIKLETAPYDPFILSVAIKETSESKGQDHSWTHLLTTWKQFLDHSAQP